MSGLLDTALWGVREGISNGLGHPGLPCSCQRGFPPAAALSLS